jgi:hypothetical protein
VPIALGERDQRLLVLANGEYVGQAGGELMAECILDVDGLEAALVLLPALDHSNAPGVPATRHHHEVPNVELDEIHDLVGLQLNLDGVIGFDERVWVADGAAVVGVQGRNAFLSKLHRPDLAELELQSRIQPQY